MKAMVIGGGVGGPVAAMALRRVGIEATVYESHAGPAEWLGLFVGLGVNGMRVLQQLNLIDAVMVSDTVPTPTLRFSSTTGKVLGSVSNGWLDDSIPSITLMRGVLQSVLASEAKSQGVAVHYGKRLTGLRQDADQVTATFADGTQAQGDLLIGADGIHSLVRRLVMPDAPAPNYTGLLNVGGIARCASLSPTPNTMHMIWGKRAYFGYTVRNSGEAWWFANLGARTEPTTRELSATSTASWQRRLRELFADDCEFIDQIIGATPSIAAWPIHDMPSLPRWHVGRVALLGDAAHAVSPSAGQGASLALEDALVLANCLRSMGVSEAFDAYERERRPRVERIVEEGRRRGKYKALESRSAIFIRDLLMPVAFRLFARDSALAWIYDFRVPWPEDRQALRSPDSARN